MTDSAYWRGRRVLVTGHTGFKGGWLAFWLCQMGAVVSGISLEPQTNPNLFELLKLEKKVPSVFIDVRERNRLMEAIASAQPETIFHLASQPLVRRSIANPYETFSTNVVGLVNVLDAARALPNAVFVNVTSDKVYENDESGMAYAEDARLGGADPYSASKACAELVTKSYVDTYGAERWLASARAGNVIGGGDWSEDRLVPDLVRAVKNGEELVLRFPNSTRPWQHVLEPLSGYLLLAQRLGENDPQARGAWNFGPAEKTLLPVSKLAEALLREMGAPTRWNQESGGQPKEKEQLHVDSSRARANLGWRSRLSINQAVAWTARWYAAWMRGADMIEYTLSQIEEYARN